MVGRWRAPGLPAPVPQSGFALHAKQRPPASAHAAGPVQMEIRHRSGRRKSARAIAQASPLPDRGAGVAGLPPCFTFIFRLALEIRPARQICTDKPWRKPDPMTSMESPCILVCAIDDKTGYCFGCGRTRDEIGAWLTMTVEARSDVMALLPARLDTVERRPRRETRRSRMARERAAGDG